LRDWDGAAQHLARWLDEAPGEPALDRAVVRVRQGEVLQRLARWTESQQTLREALGSALLEREDRWEATALLARALAQGGAFAEAELALLRVHRELDAAARADGVRYGWHAALSWFVAGEIERLRARSLTVATVDDIDAASTFLDEKAALYLQAREHYRKAIAGRVPEWGGAAALALGQVFEDFRSDWLGAPPPAAISDPEELAVYVALVEEKTRIFLEKAVADYRNLIDVAPRYDLGPDWVDALREAKERCTAELLRLTERERMREATPAAVP
jgi:tetratricopeptide (TPR) repeat protein